MPNPSAASARMGAPRLPWPRLRLGPWVVSWLQVSPMALILFVLFALPTMLFFVIR